MSGSSIVIAVVVTAFIAFRLAVRHFATERMPQVTTSDVGNARINFECFENLASGNLIRIKYNYSGARFTDDYKIMVFMEGESGEIYASYLMPMNGTMDFTRHKQVVDYQASFRTPNATGELTIYFVLLEPSAAIEVTNKVSFDDGLIWLDGGLDEGVHIISDMHLRPAKRTA